MTLPAEVRAAPGPIKNVLALRHGPQGVSDLPGWTRMTIRSFRLAALGLSLGSLAGCETLQLSTPPAAEADAPNPVKRPSAHWLRVGQYVFYSDHALDPADPLFQELDELPEQIRRELAVSHGDSLVQVYLFEGQDKYDAYMLAKYPRLPSRRAYFIAEPRAGGGDELLVYTWLGDNVRTDLRHELTHATLHSMLKGVPLWLDEGLASFFELPPSADGVNAGHLDTLRRGPFQPDLGRLEKFGQVRQMEKPEYREAWAWVHLMLRGRPEARQVLLEYVQLLRKDANPGPLQPKLREAVGDPAAALAEHITRK